MFPKIYCLIVQGELQVGKLLCEESEASFWFFYIDNAKDVVCSSCHFTGDRDVSADVDVYLIKMTSSGASWIGHLYFQVQKWSTVWIERDTETFLIKCYFTSNLNYVPEVPERFCCSQTYR